MDTQNAKGIKPNYSRVIIAPGFLMVATSLGLCSSGRNLYLTAITDALNIPRGAFSLANTIRYFTTTVVNLFFGKLCHEKSSAIEITDVRIALSIVKKSPRLSIPETK